MILEIPDEILREGIALGVERALAAGIREELRTFLESYFGCLTKTEVAALLGVSERTVEALWQSESIPKDTALGGQLPRVWLPALKEVLASSRIAVRTGRPAKPSVVSKPKLQVVKSAA